VRASGCFYSGFTSSCAPANEIGKPAAEAPSLKVLVNLNVRNEARDDAAVLGVIPASSCITAEVCLNAADGPWCRAQFDGKTGWFRKLALRQNRWPVVTFFNACE
jgi:SH3-like domain-containing protein